MRSQPAAPAPGPHPTGLTPGQADQTRQPRPRPGKSGAARGLILLQEVGSPDPLYLREARLPAARTVPGLADAGCGRGRGPAPAWPPGLQTPGPRRLTAPAPSGLPAGPRNSLLGL